MKRFSLYLIGLLGAWMLACPAASAQGGGKAFRLPDVPTVLTAPADRAAYLALHYWDHFDFTDVSQLAEAGVAEQAFVDFLSVLPYTTQAAEAVDTLYRRAAAGGEEMLYGFISLGDKYLYEPNSPMHNEELYILVLQALVESPALKEADKVRPRSLLKMALKNRPGKVAEDFAFVCRDGSRQRLSALQKEFLILYFNDPECDDCRRVKGALTISSPIGALLKSGRLGILSVCVEGNTPAWQQAVFPRSWVDGYDEGQRLTAEGIYDLKAMPTLYVLDSAKRVVLKDASVKQIEEWAAKQ